jgi:hypothetical protein
MEDVTKLVHRSGGAALVVDYGDDKGAMGTTLQVGSITHVDSVQIILPLLSNTQLFIPSFIIILGRARAPHGVAARRAGSHRPHGARRLSTAARRGRAHSGRCLFQINGGSFHNFTRLVSLLSSLSFLSLNALLPSKQVDAKGATADVTAQPLVSQRQFLRETGIGPRTEQLVGGECSCDVHLCFSALCARKSDDQYATPFLQLMRTDDEEQQESMMAAFERLTDEQQMGGHFKFLCVHSKSMDAPVAFGSVDSDSDADADAGSDTAAADDTAAAK